MNRLAGRQHGVVTRAQLLALGLSPKAIKVMLRRRQLRPLHRGVYLVGAAPPPLVHEHAALLACGRGAVLSHTTAARLHELLPYPAEGTPVEITVPCGHRPKHPGITIHRAALDRTDWWTRNHLRVTTPLRTLLDLAATAPSLLEPALREAQARRLVRLDSLRAAVDGRAGRRGTRRLRRLLAHGHGPQLTRSGAERRLLRLIERARLPAPRTNVRVGRWEVDMLWPEHGLVVEVDGYAAHSSPSAFEKDRAREADMRALGLRLRRFSARQIAAEPEATLASLARELAI